MTEIPRLLRTGWPKEDESFLGYIARLTEQNGYQSFSWICRFAGISFKLGRLGRYPFSLFNYTVSLNKLSQITGVRHAELSRLFYLRASKPSNTAHYQFYGQEAHKYVIRPIFPKICPSCLVESSYCRRIWELTLVTACPKHMCLLIDECPKCERRIQSLRSSVSVCSCKFDWREVDVITLKEQEVALAKHIYLLCGLTPNDKYASTLAEQSPVFALNLQEFISALIFIASQQRGLSGITGKLLTREMRNKELHILYRKAFSVFENWPHNFYKFLDWRRAQERNNLSRDERLKFSLGKDFGNFYSGMYRFFPSGSFDFMKTAFGEYLLSHWEGAYVPSTNRNRFKRSPQFRGSNQYVPRVEARRLLGVNYKIIDHYVETGKLKASVRNRGKNRIFLIEVPSLAALKRELDQNMGRRLPE